MLPQLNEFYQHRYGGLYVVDDVATHTTTKERLVIYSHVYPFEEATWARPIDDWTEEKFRLISFEESQRLMERDRFAFQTEIAMAKARR